MNQQLKINYRETVVPADVEIVRDITKSSGFFNTEEIKIAAELVEARLSEGKSSGYYFIFAEIDGHVVSYSCYGPIEGTKSSYDLYWIATHNNYRGKGIGKKLIIETEKRIAQAKGKNIYVETASKPQYEPTRKFYESMNYVLEARLKQFYADDDDKLIYVKRV
jgi:ribosomal protein S18 acetylase RimI-like enzyme